MVFSLVDERTRKRLKFVDRSAKRKEAAKFATEAQDENAIFSPKLLCRARCVARKVTPKSFRVMVRNKICKFFNGEIPLDARKQKSQLLTIVKMIDHFYFNDTVEDALAAWHAFKNGRHFSVNSAVTEEQADDGIAGFTTLGDSHASILIDYDQLVGVNHKSSVGKIRCRTKLMCLILLIEHEMCHLFCFLFRADKMHKDNVHGSIFKRYLIKIFGQTTINHDL